MITYGPEMVHRYEKLLSEIEILEKQAKALREEIERSEKKVKYPKRLSKKANIDRKMDWTAISIDEMALSSRTYGILHYKKVHTLYDLSNYSHEDLMSIRRMGEITVKEIEEKAAKFGLYIRKG